MLMHQYDSEFYLLMHVHSQLEVFRPCFSDNELILMKSGGVWDGGGAHTILARQNLLR